MRVGTRSLYEGIEQRMLILSDNLRKINEKISGGKRINRPSDDPIAWVEATRVKSILSQLGQYDRNMQMGETWLNMGETSIRQALELVRRAQELTSQMATDTQNAATRANAAKEVGLLLDQAVSLGNTQTGGSYIFSGYKTRTAPFQKVTIGGIETAQYHGDMNNFQIQMGKNEMLTVGINGQTVFMDSNLFDTLGNLKKALEDNDPQNISLQLNQLKGVENYLNNQVADVGARTNRLNFKKEMAAHFNLNFEERLSGLEDADLVGLIVELKRKEMAYQATLMSSAMIGGLSLLNYLK